MAITGLVLGYVGACVTVVLWIIYTTMYSVLM